RFFERVVSAPLRTLEKLHPARGGEPADGRLIDDLGACGLHANAHKSRKGMGFAEAISAILLAEDDGVEIVLAPCGRARDQQQNAGDHVVWNHGVNPRMSATKR